MGVDLTLNRRTVTPKDYKSGGRISEEDLSMILDAANWAPTHNKTQPWRYVMLSGMVGSRYPWPWVTGALCSN